MTEELTQLATELETILNEMAGVRMPEAGDVMVVGCSTSEIQGKRIGKAGSPDIAGVLYPVLQAFADAHELDLAFQCCEHLNRALVVEKATAKAHGLDLVSAVPHSRAGGSMSAEAYRSMKAPCLVETIRAGYGIDIGETMIGMHMRPVVVPMRLPHNRVGDARVNGAFSRPKLIGGERAVYDEPLNQRVHE